MYTYPEALNAFEKILLDLFKRSYPEERWSVRVVADSVSGTASVDWSGTPGQTDVYGMRVTVHMPVRPAASRMTEKEFRQWAAYGLHEVGHPNDTDMKTWKDAVRTGRHRLLNSVEDVRIEKRTIERGIAANAKAVLSDLVGSIYGQSVDAGYDPNDVASIGWTLAVLGRKANGYDFDCSDIWTRLNPKGVVAGILKWALPQIDACQSTGDCLALCDRIVRAVNAGRRAGKPEGDGPGKGKGKGNGKGKAGKGGAGEGKPVEGGGSSPRKPFTHADVKEQGLQPVSVEAITQQNGIEEWLVQSTLQSTLMRVLREVEANEGRSSTLRGSDIAAFVKGLVGRSASEMGRQRALLAKALKANETDGFDGGRRHGRLDRKALSRVATGAGDVFGKRTIIEGYDTDVQILVDGSGSMSGHNIVAASTLALVVAQAAKQVGVDCTAHVFNDAGLHCAGKGKERPDAGRYAAMVAQVCGGTPLTHSLLKAAILQAKRAGAKRRVLFVISDGVCNMGSKVVKAAGQYVEAAFGTEIANLHIGTPMGCFRNEVGIDVHNVSAVGLRQLTALLEKKLV